MNSNINDFLAETNREIAKLQAKQVSEAKKIVLYTYEQILELSPVDTSFFKANNFLTVNSKTNKMIDGGKPTKKGRNSYNSEAESTANDGTSSTLKAKLKHGTTITIQNHLDYADALEAGHSEQASGGVYGIAERKAKRKSTDRIKIK